MFHYFFLDFGASIRGYMYYLMLIIYVTYGYLNGLYKCTLLLTTAQDTNKQIYPLARKIVDAETKKNHGCDFRRS